jgi:hypothetical protein
MIFEKKQLIENLFAFPIVMVDGDNEERKSRERESMQGLGLSTEDDEQEMDIIIGEAECPYYDFFSVTDRWLPTSKSLNRAISGKFEACFVTFGTCGSFVVPWSKEKFKQKLKEFIDTKVGDE